MKNLLSVLLLLLFILPRAVDAQILSTTRNEPYQATSRTKLPEGATVYGVFVGRTPCEELSKELKEPREGCIKRKLRLTLFQDSITREPTFYEIRGMGRWSGKGRWRIERGTADDPKATVFQLQLDQATVLHLLKGDDNVLFILGNTKDLLAGNEKFSYTLNRARN